MAEQEGCAVYRAFPWRFARGWKTAKSGPAVTQAFVPLNFAPGEVRQFDWSHEQVELAGVMLTIKVAHFRLTFSRQMSVVAYPRETPELGAAFLLTR